MSTRQRPFWRGGVPAMIQGQGRLIVSNRDLKPVLDSHIERAEKHAKKVGNVNKNGHTFVLEDLGLQAAALLQHCDDAGRRRLYGIRKLESETSIIDWADAFLDAIGSHLTLEEIPVFPSSRGSAREMVAAHSDCDLYESLTLPEQRELAKRLYDFTRGYCYAERAFEALEAEEAAVA